MFRGDAMTYNFLREFADSWALLVMALFFMAATAFAFRPGSRDYYDRAAKIPLQNSSED
jgi:cytochrome c oxidase cbb3-type subunit IV